MSDLPKEGRWRVRRPSGWPAAQRSGRQNGPEPFSGAWLAGQPDSPAEAEIAAHLAGHLIDDFRLVLFGYLTFKRAARAAATCLRNLAVVIVGGVFVSWRQIAGLGQLAHYKT